MDRDTELQRLEQFVDKLLASFAELKEEKKILLKKVKDRDAQIVELQNNLASKDSERSEISMRVGKLVEQIEDWELALEDDESAEDDSGEEGEAAEDGEEEVEEGRVQHNLFSMSGPGE